MYLIRALRRLRRLRRDEKGLAMLEFALSLPVVLPLGLYAIELSNYALVQMRLSQIALTLADNASRVGVTTSLNVQELREFDINEVFQGVRLQGSSLNIAQRGRITLSSLEVNAQGGQWIRWQRCLGLKSGTDWDSSYGREGDGATGTSLTGMGPTGSTVTAPPGAAVMFVELNYEYQPLITEFFLGTPNTRFIASFIVRDNRDLAKGITNPAPTETPMLCSNYTT
ncbi:MAG: histidine kinase [Sphingomonas sp.]|jgi:Flp pilus assembly protein TadG|uniref:TadE/TadG family type IV pilus assembly protein n=1 Tax=Sphingomonas sp. TaxID=28214 RepID=UPI0025FD5FEF|nr:TadE/TadG family type IV pilus assembly protein [Sphingomonas sp.]MBX9881940.1 histidine kinase [Sphingomonas sp.]